ncbi:MAG TPA: type II toxin-antitoxin system RelE/ParE family toxin [Longimicrobiaceae bacterium]|nr:type II toxin-antitoxin system RelE/ParE family toxin [Longimicrobiaceae bacterium]
MRFEVRLTAGAERDLAAIHRYLAEASGAGAADRLLRRILEVATRLAEHPDRGSHPPELLALGVREYRQIILKPYRIIYRIIDQTVFVTVIADGRRNMQALLARRLLEE